MIGSEELRRRIIASVEGKKLKKVLIIPPDYTRLYSGAGEITAIYYEYLSPYCEVDVMPALGTHVPMTRAECESFFRGVVPFDKLLVHSWRTDVVKIGEVPAEFVAEVSDGLVDTPIDVEINRRLLDDYDLIISVGQVVPHEVVGMANYSKNIFVGVGGASMINSSHMLGAFYGMERIMGRDYSPVRKVFDYAQEHFLTSLPLLYVLTVTTNSGDETLIHGLYIGNTRHEFEQAVSLSQEKNLIRLPSPLKRCVVMLDPREFKSTWLGNKAIYRTRMAMADGGDLIILAPGVERFGEDAENDRLIRKYGYVGRERILELVRQSDELRGNLSVAAHLIHGSSDGRFNITYCTSLLSGDEVRSVGFGYRPYTDASAEFAGMTDGMNGDTFYISNPALGLWTV